MTNSVKHNEDDRAQFQKPSSEIDRADSGTTPAAERTNNTLRAYHEIRRRILDGDMEPGTQFLEQELAELLEMSRTPVREALIRLAEERLVEVRPRHGVRILPVSADDIRDIYDLLIEIEAYAVRRIAERGLRNEDYIALTDAIVQMESCLKAGDLKNWSDAERGFHRRLLAACGNAKAAEVARVLGDQSHRARMVTLTAMVPTVEITRGHADLVDALRRQNPQEAEQVRRQQMLRSAHRIVDFMKQREGTG